MDMSQAPGWYLILDEPPPQYDSLYPAYEPPSPNPSSIMYPDPSLPPYQPSPHFSATISRPSESSPPDNHEPSAPSCKTHRSSLHTPPRVLVGQWLDYSYKLKANNYDLVFSFFNLILFLPVGLISIICCFKVRWLIHKGEFQKAEKLSGDIYPLINVFFYISLLLAIPVYTAIILICVLNHKDAPPTENISTYYLAVDFSPR
ncbi:hypothetical protein XELAEV_18036452mg [Xenopus laevis]|uniref:Uncharacterized protein n=1 Tax=Xenopus laevis TaxID=8355 RepID=A0A974HD21_XENLA|nr:hypothetical protein XELAEV_18036452mg [Xenopus laevis]